MYYLCDLLIDIHHFIHYRFFGLGGRMLWKNIDADLERTILCISRNKVSTRLLENTNIAVSNIYISKRLHKNQHYNKFNIIGVVGMC